MLSTFSRTRVARMLVGTALAAAVIAPDAGAQQDLRSPDSRESSRTASPSEDLRSPDARVQSASPSEDLRSPDARVPLPEPESRPIVDAPSVPSGFDWVSAAIGAAAGTGMLLVVIAFLAMGGIRGRHHGTA